MTTSDTGRAVKDRACRYLQPKDLELVECNYYCGQGELDLIIRDLHTMVLIEACYRKPYHYGSDAETVGSRTLGKLAASALHHLQQHKQAANQLCFFDVISLTAWRPPR